MKGIQPGHEVLSLFGIASDPQALAKKLSLSHLVFGAFFVALILGFAMSGLVRVLDSARPVGSSITISDEQVAFQPSQNVQTELSRGYLGK